MLDTVLDTVEDREQGMGLDKVRGTERDRELGMVQDILRQCFAPASEDNR